MTYEGNPECSDTLNFSESRGTCATPVEETRQVDRDSHA